MSVVSLYQITVETETNQGNDTSRGFGPHLIRGELMLARPEINTTLTFSNVCESAKRENNR